MLHAHRVPPSRFRDGSDRQFAASAAALLCGHHSSENFISNSVRSCGGLVISKYFVTYLFRSVFCFGFLFRGCRVGQGGRSSWCAFMCSHEWLTLCLCLSLCLYCVCFAACSGDVSVIDWFPDRPFLMFCF